MDVLVQVLEKQFVQLYLRSLELIEATPAEKLYWQPLASNAESPTYSCAEYVLRSAAAVEQTFGGITSNLWDDPFEWTLPETLATRQQIVGYLQEVENTRQRGFDLFGNVDDLYKEIVLPSGERQSLHDLILDTLMRAAHHQGCAYATFRLFSDERIPTIRP
jgi:hypothetical protein